MGTESERWALVAWVMVPWALVVATAFGPDGTIWLLLILGIYLLLGSPIAYFFVRSFGTSARSKRWIVLGVTLAWFAIPFGDMLWEWFWFERMCAAEAGMHVYRRVQNVEGFYAKGEGSGGAQSFLKTYGYRYIESNASERVQMYSRYTLSGDGTLVEQHIDAPASRYGLRSQYTDAREHVLRDDLLIEDRATSILLARSTQFVTAFGWLSRLLDSYGLRSRVNCDGSYGHSLFVQRIHEILIPAR